MRLLMIVMAILSMCALTGCTKSGTQGAVCQLEQGVATGLSTVVASTLSCSNTSQIQTDILGALGKANFCTQTTTTSSFFHHEQKLKGPIGDIVCPTAVSSVMALLQNKVPTSWVDSSTR